MTQSHKSSRDRDEPIIAYDWFSLQFTIEQRAESVTQVGLHLMALFWAIAH